MEQVSNTKLQERYNRTIRLPNGSKMLIQVLYVGSHVEFFAKVYTTGTILPVVTRARRSQLIREPILAAALNAPTAKGTKLPPRYNRMITLPSGSKIRFFAYAVDGVVEVFVMPEDALKSRVKRLRVATPAPDPVSELGFKLADIIEEYAIVTGRRDHPIHETIKAFRAEMLAIDTEDEQETDIIERYLADNPHRDPDDYELRLGPVREFNVWKRREITVSGTFAARSALEAEAIAYYTDETTMNLEQVQTVFPVLHVIK